MGQTVTAVRTAPIRPMAVLLVGQAMLQMLDLWTTFVAIQGGAVEANPVSRAIIEGPGWGAYAAVKLVLAAAFLALLPALTDLEVRERRVVGTSLSIFGLFMLAVVINNAIILF